MGSGGDGRWDARAQSTLVPLPLPPSLPFSLPSPSNRLAPAHGLGHAVGQFVLLLQGELQLELGMGRGRSNGAHQARTRRASIALPPSLSAHLFAVIDFLKVDEHAGRPLWAPEAENESNCCGARTQRTPSPNPPSRLSANPPHLAQGVERFGAAHHARQTGAHAGGRGAHRVGKPPCALGHAPAAVCGMLQRHGGGARLGRVGAWQHVGRGGGGG